MSNTSTLQKRLVAELFGTNGLTSFNDVISFDDAAQKFRRGTLQEASPYLQQYIERRILLLLRLNVTAGKAG